MEGFTTGNIDRNIADSVFAFFKNLQTAEAAQQSAKAELANSSDTKRVQPSDASVSVEKKQQRAELTKERLEAISEDLNRVLENKKGIHFDVSDDGKELVVQVVDLESDEVIRTISSDRAMDLSEQLGKLGSGFLLDDQA